MNFGRIKELFGGAAGAAGALTVGAEIARAQENSGGTIDIGGSIADTVHGAVSGIATNSSASGGSSSEHNEIHLGEQEGLAIADASGGDHNLSFVS
jgi:hypothetical protein